MNSVSCHKCGCAITSQSHRFCEQCGTSLQPFESNKSKNKTVTDGTSDESFASVQKDSQKGSGDQEETSSNIGDSSQTYSTPKGQGKTSEGTKLPKHKIAAIAVLILGGIGIATPVIIINSSSNEKEIIQETTETPNDSRPTPRPTPKPTPRPTPKPTPTPQATLSAPSSVSVVVANGTSVTGAAGNVRDYLLSAQDFNVLPAVNDTETLLLQDTRIYYDDGYQRDAELIGFILRVEVDAILPMTYTAWRLVDNRQSTYDILVHVGLDLASGGSDDGVFNVFPDSESEIATPVNDLLRAIEESENNLIIPTNSRDILHLNEFSDDIEPCIVDEPSQEDYECIVGNYLLYSSNVSDLVGDFSSNIDSYTSNIMGVSLGSNNDLFELRSAYLEHMQAWENYWIRLDHLTPDNRFFYPETSESQAWITFVNGETEYSTEISRTWISTCSKLDELATQYDQFTNRVDAMCSE